MTAVNHFQYECLLCKETWLTEDQLTYHERQDHHYYKECKKNFQNSSNLKMHLNSCIHRRHKFSVPFVKALLSALLVLRTTWNEARDPGLES